MSLDPFLSLLDLFLGECVVHGNLVIPAALVQVKVVSGAWPPRSIRGRPTPGFLRFVRGWDAGFLRGTVCGGPSDVRSQGSVGGGARSE